MSLISDEDKEYLRERFDLELEAEVNLLVFYKSEDCEHCKETVEIAREVASLNNKIKLKTYEVDEEREKAEELKVKLVPATLIDKGNEYRIRWYGIPSGYEFATYIEDLISVSSNRPKLSESSLKEIGKIDEGLQIQVFVTPTCPYCPRMSLMAHQAALANERISADVIEAIEFPELSSRYKVMGVPKTVINENYRTVGLLPEPLFTELLLYASGRVDKPSKGLLRILDEARLEEDVHEHRHDI